MIAGEQLIATICDKNKHASVYGINQFGPAINHSIVYGLCADLIVRTISFAQHESELFPNRISNSYQEEDVLNPL